MKPLICLLVSNVVSYICGFKLKHRLFCTFWKEKQFFFCKIIFKQSIVTEADSFSSVSFSKKINKHQVKELRRITDKFYIFKISCRWNRKQNLKKMGEDNGAPNQINGGTRPRLTSIIKDLHLWSKPSSTKWKNYESLVLLTKKSQAKILRGNTYWSFSF